MTCIGLSAKESCRSVVIAWARTATRASSLCLLANAGEQRPAAAAPQVGGQHWRRVSGSATIGEARTSSTVTGCLKMAYGLLAACLRALLEILAKASDPAPYFSWYSRPP